MRRRRKRNDYVYLGKRVRDVRGEGLDSPSEYRGIMRAIMKDYKSGRITRRKALGRLLLLYRLTYPENNSKASRIAEGTREEIRREIRRAMERL